MCQVGRCLSESGAGVGGQPGASHLRVPGVGLRLWVSLLPFSVGPTAKFQSEVPGTQGTARLCAHHSGHSDGWTLKEGPLTPGTGRICWAATCSSALSVSAAASRACLRGGYSLPTLMGSWTISVASVNLGTSELLIFLNFKVDLEALIRTRIFLHQINVLFFF